MKQIDKKQYNKLSNGRYLLYRNTRFEKIYFIFNLLNLTDDHPIKYRGERIYYFSIPTDNRTTCFCYSGVEKVNVEWNDEIYEISQNEYLDLFRIFVKNDGKSKYDINFDQMLKEVNQVNFY